MRLRQGTAHAAVGMTLLAAWSCAAVADEVVLVSGATVKQASGGRVRGTVQSESATEVVVKLGANNVSVPADQIAAVRYDGQPPSLVLAESKEAAGLLAEAGELFKKAATEAQAKPFVAQAAKYKQAEVAADLALADPAKAAEAVGLLDAFLKAYPNGRHSAAALESLARLQLQKGDPAAVEAAVAAIAKLPNGEDRAAVLRARMFARQGDDQKAVAEFDRIIKGAAPGSLRAREARLARAESLAALKLYAEAEAEVGAVIKAAPPEDVVAQSAAYNTLGDCLKAANRPKEALLAYLHTDLLYAKDKAQHPRALARISQLWRQLNRPDRAEEAMQRLKQEYPQSPWVATAAGTS